jgi:hypothetical protein
MPDVVLMIGLKARWTKITGRVELRIPKMSVSR